MTLAKNMLCVTTNSIDGKVVQSYRGVVAAEVVFGVNFLRDFVASFTDAGGRSNIYEKEFDGARKSAVELIVKKAEALGADAILAMRFDYHGMGENNGMIVVAVSGTAVRLAKSEEERAKDEEHEREEKPIHFVRVGSSERGPFSMAQLLELIAAGRIEESSTVRVDGRDGVKTIRELLGKNG